MPAQIRAQGADHARRARLCVLFASGIVAVGIAGAAIHLIRGSGWIALSLACAALWAAACPFVLLHRRSLSLTAGSITWAWFMTTLVIAFSRGGYGAAAVFPMLVTPLLAILLAGRRAAIVWGAATFGGLMLLYTAKILGLEFYDQVPMTAMPIVHAIMGTLFMLMMLGIGMSYEMLKSTALEDVRRGEQEVLREHEERMRAEAQAQTMFADRMASIGRLSAGVAHEVNNPLSFILANLQFVREELQRRADPMSRELEEAIEDAVQGAIRIRGIVRDLGIFSRAEDEKLNAVDVHEALDTTIRMVTNEARHRATLIKNYGDVPPVRASLARLSQVFLNILLNSIQAIPVGRAEEDQIKITTRNEGSMVVVEIEDTGVGIPEDLIGRVTDPFFTTKPPGSGTGLGLSVSRSIVERFGGTLEIASTLGRGTAVTVRLLDALESEQAAPEQAAPARTSLRRARVLIIDDDPQVAKALARVLKDHEVRTVGAGREALILLATDERFDVVFCDLMLPDVTGIEIYESAKRRSAALSERFVFISGGVLTSAARDFVEQMTGRFLEKPFDETKVRCVVEKFVGAAAPSPIS